MRLYQQLNEPEKIFEVCKTALPSWQEVTIQEFSHSRLEGGLSSPGVFVVKTSKEGVFPCVAVLRIEPGADHPFYEAYDYKKNFKVGKQVLHRLL